MRQEHRQILDAALLVLASPRTRRVTLRVAASRSGDAVETRPTPATVPAFVGMKAMIAMSTPPERTLAEGGRARKMPEVPLREAAPEAPDSRIQPAAAGPVAQPEAQPEEARSRLGAAHDPAAVLAAPWGVMLHWLNDADAPAIEAKVEPARSVDPGEILALPWSTFLAELAAPSEPEVREPAQSGVEPIHHPAGERDTYAEPRAAAGTK
jgi:hypothetical protein